VQFEDKKFADEAIEKCTELLGAKIVCSPFKAREARASSINKYNNLYVKDIPKAYTDENLKTLFSEYGKVLSAVVIKENSTDPTNKGFGFVSFEKTEDAKMAEEKLNKFSVEGKELFVARALTKQDHKTQMREDRMKRFKDCNLFVKELPDDVTDVKLKEAFEVFGIIVSARVMMESKIDPATNASVVKSKNFGFVCFTKKEDAAAAISGSQNRQIFGRTLYVAIAERKEDRQAKSPPNYMMHYGPPMGMYPMGPPPMGMYPPYGRPHRGRVKEFIT
jgi:polyadenylate-binding protein